MGLKEWLGTKSPAFEASQAEDRPSLPGNVTPLSHPPTSGVLIHSFRMEGISQTNVDEAKRAIEIYGKVREITEPVGMAVGDLREHVVSLLRFSGIDNYEPLQREPDKFVPISNFNDFIMKEGLEALKNGDLFDGDVLQDPVDGVGEILERSEVASNLLPAPEGESVRGNIEDERKITLPRLVERLTGAKHPGIIELNLYKVSSVVSLEEK